MALLFSSIELCPSARCKGDINMCPKTPQAHEEEKKQALKKKEIEIFHKKSSPNERKDLLQVLIKTIIKVIEL